MDSFSAGKRPAQWILAEYPELQNKARHWVRSKARRKGRSTMKAEDFRSYINDDLLKVGTAEALVDSKVAGKKLNQDLCDVCTVADAETMIRDYHDALERDELPFEINL